MYYIVTPAGNFLHVRSDGTWRVVGEPENATPFRVRDEAVRFLQGTGLSFKYKIEEGI